MVRHNGEVATDEEHTHGPHSPDEGIQLTFERRVLSFSVRQRLGTTCTQVLLTIVTCLAEHASDAVRGEVTVQAGGTGRIELAQCTPFCAKLINQCTEVTLMISSPRPGHILAQEVGEAMGEARVVGAEATVVPTQSQRRAEGWDVGRAGQGLDRVDLCTLGGHAVW